MNTKILFGISTIIFNLITSIIADEDSKCPLISSNIIKQESELIKIIENKMHKLKINSAECIDVLVKSGKFKALDIYLSELSKRNIKYKESLDMSINTVKKSLEEISNKHKYNEIEYQIVKPAFQWAQSLKDIFIEVKFAHRLDAPGCLEMKNLKVDIKEDQVNLVGYCVLGDVPMKMDFHVNLFKHINLTNCTHHPDSVGRYKITLEKKKSGYWRKLLKDGSEIPNNMKVWFQMRDKFEEELKPYVEADEDKEFNAQLRKMGVKMPKKKKNKNKKDKNHKNIKNTNNTNNTVELNNNKNDTHNSTVKNDTKKTDL